MRFILLIAAILLLFFIVRTLLLSKSSKPRSDNQDKRLKKVVPCSVCDLHIPIVEAIQHKEQYFCSEAHLQEWQESKDE